MFLKRAHVSDAEVLTTISKEAFDSDVECGADKVGGPPGYDSLEWQCQMLQNTTAHYYKLLLADKVIGGAIVFPLKEEGQFCLGRIFLAKEARGVGLGLKAMTLVEQTYPQARRWVLNTPAWNTRTRAFYLRAGYTLCKEDEFLWFEKLYKGKPPLA